MPATSTQQDNPPKPSSQNPKKKPDPGWKKDEKRWKDSACSDSGYEGDEETGQNVKEKKAEGETKVTA
jgi:hypothetical protein